MRETVIGLLPDSWNLVQFEEIREWLQYGTSVHCTLEEKSYPVLRIPNVELGRVNTSDLKYCDLPADEAQKYLLHDGDLLFIRTNGVLERLGACAVYRGAPRAALFASYLIRARLKAAVDPRYVAYFYASELGTSLVASRATPAADGKYNLNTGTIDSLPLALPSDLDEQRAIVGILSRAESAAAKQSETLGVLRTLKRAAMRELFARGLRGEVQKETDIGPVPESWAVTTIGAVALRTQYGLSVRGKSEGRFPILRMNCQDDGHVAFRDLQYVDLDDATFSSYRLEEGDLLFNRTNSIEHVGRMAMFEGTKDAVFASYLVRLTVDANRCLPSFLNYYMNSEDVQRDIKRLASRAVGQANINATKLRTVAFPLPTTLDEQREIVAVLDAIDRKIDLHRRKGAVLEELFKSLLQKLVTGATRVDQLDLSALQGTTPEAAA